MMIKITLPDGTIKVLVVGIDRANIKEFNSKNDYLIANYSLLKIKSQNNSNIRALIKIILEQFESYKKINKKISTEIINNLKSYNDYNKLSDVVIANLNINLTQKQELLENASLEKSLDKIYGYLIAEIDSMQIEKKIKGRVKRQMEKTQKEYYLNEQMKAIQKELGDNDEVDDIAEIENKLKKLKLSSEAREKCK